MCARVSHVSQNYEVLEFVCSHMDVLCVSYGRRTTLNLTRTEDEGQGFGINVGSDRCMSGEDEWL
jgi:hypothetical protein